MINVKEVELLKYSSFKVISKTNCFKSAILYWYSNGKAIVFVLDRNNIPYSFRKANKNEIRTYKSLDAARRTVEKLGFKHLEVLLTKGDA